MKWDTDYCLIELARHKKNIAQQKEDREDDMVMLDIWDLNFLMSLAVDGVQAMKKLNEISGALEPVYEKLKDHKEAR